MIIQEQKCFIQSRLRIYYSRKMVLNYVWFIFLIQNLFVVHGAISQQPLFHVQDIKFPLSAYDMKIADATGRRVKLAGGNYAGSHMIRHCVNGLQCRPLRDIALDIRFKFRMNCIRLTYSLEMIYDNNIVQLKYLKANPQMNGKTSLEVFDYVIKTLTQVGLMVILNNHISTSKWCCSQTDGNGLWWTQEYPEDLYLKHAQQFAKRYKNNPRVIGMDLRNQIRKANNTQPTWGAGNTKTDWKRAAQITGQLILKQAPNWLIIIGGLNYQLDLSFIAKYPIKLSIPNRLVYSGHFYSFSWQKKISTYDQFKKEFFNTQTFVRALGYPFLLGEFGNNAQDNYWIWLMQYLRQTDIDWTYWSLDGFKGQPTDDQSYGVFTNDFSAARHPDLLADMITVGPPRKALAQYSSYIPSDYSSSSNVNNQIRSINPQNTKNTRSYIY